MSPSQSEAQWPVVRRTARTVVVVDVVDSVRLYELDEEDTVRRWQSFVAQVVTHVLPLHSGRLVKSLGDGLMVEFDNVPSAIQCALAMQSSIADSNRDSAAERRLWLRVGAHVGDVFADDLDIQGRAVNLAARLCSLAGPGEIVVSADVRERLVPGLDPEVHDLGECELKGLTHTTRAYRVGPPEQGWRLFGVDTFADARATIVVLPFDVRPADADALTIGDILADDLIFGLSASPQWRVISRLSSAAYADRRPSLDVLREQLRASYVVSGRCVVESGRIRLQVELADANSSSVMWAGSLTGSPSDLTLPDNPIAKEAVDAVTAAIFSHEIRRSRAQPLPTLRSYSLLFGAVGLMHRLSRPDFEQSHAMLEHLVQRHPHAPEPRAWTAKWHVMNVAQGWSHQAVEQAHKGHEMVQRALDRQPDHALALAIDGLIAAFLRADLDTSEQRYEAAIASNPNEALAWLFMSALHAYRDRGEDAAKSALLAQALSPLDPMRYFFDSFAANAMLAAGRLEESIVLGRRSIRANCTHLPTHRSLAIAQSLAGHGDDARQTMASLLKLEPGYSVSEFRARYPGRDAKHMPAYVDALRAAGLPEN
jgi:adenylate cyclase